MKLRYLFLITFMCVSGCALIDERRTPAVTGRDDSVNQKIELEQLKARIEAMEKAYQDLTTQLDTSRAENEKEKRELKENLSAMDKSLKALAAARETDKQEIISNLSSRIADLMRGQAGQAQSTKAKEGREHIVQRGETLSAIATAYKVKPSAIIQANNLKSADSLKAGQKLIIPE